MDIFFIEATFPPSLEKYRWIGAAIVWAMWIIELLCLRWLYEIVDANRALPAPRQSYIGVARKVRFWLVFSAFTVNTPRLAQLMLWRQVGPDVRENLSIAAWVSAIVCAAMVVYAWSLEKKLAVVEQTYARSHGFVPTKPVDRTEKMRMAKVMLMVMLIALATTFVRPHTDAHHRSTAVLDDR